MGNIFVFRTSMPSIIPQDRFRLPAILLIMIAGLT
jgi:hypothetical protein